MERAVALAVALAGFVVAGAVMTDNSLLTHLATGRLILDTGAVPEVDPYSRFGTGQAWTVQSWLVSVIYASLDRVAGPAAIRLFHGGLGAAIGLGLWSLAAPAGRLSVRLALTAGPLIVGIGLWSPRPLLVGLAALVGLLLVVTGDRPGWLLVPLLWIWGNSHGSFPVAAGLVALMVVGQVIQDRCLPRARLRQLGWVGLGTVAAAVGPLGLDLLAFPLRVLGRREAMTGVVEWEAPTYTSPWELAWLAIAVLPLIAARKRLGWERLVPAVALTVAAALALRNVGPASIVVVAMVAPGLATDPGSMSDGDPRSTGRLLASVARAVAVAAIAGLVVAVATVATGPGLELERYPVAEVELLDRAGLLADDVVLVHREAVGNYLTWRDGDRAMVFVDDRFDFHADALLADHRDLLAGVGAREILDRRRADVVLWEVDAALAHWLAEAPEWSVRAGEEWLIACRRGSAAAATCPTAARVAAGGP